MRKILDWLVKQQNASELRKKIRSLKSTMSDESYQKGLLNDKINELDLTISDRDVVIEKLNDKIEFAKEDLEIEKSKGRILQVEVAELAALCANRLKKIESGTVDYREQDIADA